MMELPRILISGASGLIGSSLVRAFSTRKIPVCRLVRDRQPTSEQEISWSPQSATPVADPSQLEGFDVVIHLSGANVAAHRWTSAYKHEIVTSRVQTTQALAQLLRGLKDPPRLFLCASATGIYGARGDEILTESSSPGSGFLAETCMAWEAAAQPTTALPVNFTGIRVAHLRFGVVLSPEGGALAKMLPFFRLGLGGRIGSGQQYISWISLPDALSAIFHIIDFHTIHNSQLSGPINLVAPIPVTNADFTRTLAHVVHRPAILPAPAFALRLALGEMANEALLASARVIPARLAESGFRFQHAQLALALQALLQHQ